MSTNIRHQNPKGNCLSTVPMMLQDTTLSTSRLVLRAAQQSDAGALYEAFRDPEVMQYWSEYPHTSISRTQEWLTGMIESSQNGRTDFVICLKSSLTVIGKIGIYRSRPSNEIGFLLDRTYWGKGMAKEALSTMLEYLFNLRRHASGDDEDPEENSDSYTSLSLEEMQDEWLYPSISADVDPRNEASIRVLKKVGFTETQLVKGCFQRGDELVDSLYLRLRREAWLNR